MRFDRYIGIDYSGADTPTSRQRGLQVYQSDRDNNCKVTTPASPVGQQWNWTRKEVATWLIEQLLAPGHQLIGIDHCFSFPEAYFSRYKFQTWDECLNDFCHHWPTLEDNTTVESLRSKNQRSGSANEFRLTEKWTSSAKSIFLFDVNGAVAKSSHAGIPWLAHLRRTVGAKLHFWPFDGFDVPAGKSVIVEVYPSILRGRYDRDRRSNDEHDAYSIARWLQECDQRDILNHYFHPPLTEEERNIVLQEGWIFGIC